jgi:hypothetical protein
MSTTKATTSVPDAVDSNHAVAGLGTSTKTFMGLRRLGLIPAFSVPSRIPGRVMWRYRIEDLMAFKKKQQNQIRAWDPRVDSELPAIVIARLLGVSLQDVSTFRNTAAGRKTTGLRLFTNT